MLWDGVVATLHDVKECRVPVGVCVSGDGESEKYVKALYKSKPLLSNKVRHEVLGNVYQQFSVAYLNLREEKDGMKKFLDEANNIISGMIEDNHRSMRVM